MRTVIQILFSTIILFSCNKRNENSQQEIEPILIKIGYYPTFHQYAETIVNLNENYLIFYSPTSYSPGAPPPPKENGDRPTANEEQKYNEFLNERPRLNPFRINLSENDIMKIKSLSDSLKSDDFVDRDMIPAFDGMSTNIIVLYSDGNIAQINPLNGPTENQRMLYTEILDLLIERNTDNNDAVILQKIKDYL